MKRLTTVLCGLTPVLAIIAFGIAVSGCDAGADAMSDNGGLDADEFPDIEADTDQDAFDDDDDDFDDDDDGDDDDGEEEEEAIYKIPQGSGRYVFIADETNDAVVVVDSETTAIEVVDVGSRPTHLVGLGDQNAAMVLNLDSDEATIIRKTLDAPATTYDLAVRPDTNALVASPDGKYVIAFHNPKFTEESGLPETDQDITILTTTQGSESSVHRIVGMHPWRVVFDQQVTRAFVITEGGIAIIDLENLDEATLPDDVHLFEPGTFTPENADIEIVPDGTWAFGRKDGSATVFAVALDGTEQRRSYTMPGEPTDLDIAPDGTFGLFVLRSTNQVALFDLPLPSDPSTNPFEIFDLQGHVVGVATITLDGQFILLHTTTGGDEDDQRRLTVLSHDGVDWQVGSSLMERKIRAIAPGVDSKRAVVMHQPIQPDIGEQPHSYSLVTIPDLKVKFQQIPVEPRQLLLTPDGEFGFLLLNQPRQLNIFDLNTFIVDALDLGSPPTAAGYAVNTDKVFVAQDHPAGRMTFIGVHDESLKTVTGYNLNRGEVF